MNTFTTSAAALALAAVTATASAGIRTYQVRPGNFSFTTPTALVPLNAAGNTTITWNQTSNGRKVLIFTAECSVDAPAGNNFAWVDIDIVFNGVVQAPTVGTSDAFCSADGLAGFGGYVRPSIAIVINGVAGANTISIQGRINAGATGGWLSDTTLVVHD